jgi:hypothetical protein
MICDPKERTLPGTSYYSGFEADEKAVSAERCEDRVSFFVANGLQYISTTLINSNLIYRSLL